VNTVRPTPVSLSLSVADPGARLRVTSVGVAHADELVREGILPGAVVQVASRTPLGGPVIVCLGRVRLALSADVAADVVGEPVP
jgi:Fe2+ transport system protein FeoA